MEPDAKIEAYKPFVQAAYQATLNRPADPKGLAYYAERMAQNKLTPEELLSLLMKTEERKNLLSIGEKRIGNISQSKIFREHGTKTYAERTTSLRAGAANYLTQLAEALSTLNAQGKLSNNPVSVEYFAFHHRRFSENCHALDWMRTALGKKGKEFSVLEVGSGLTVMLYKKIFPDITIGSADLFFNPFISDIVCGQWKVDLNAVDTREHDLTPDFQFDVVLFCEVLEHLVVNPENLFSMLARSIKPGGFLYVTTPNFYAAHVRQKIANYRNPQHLFPARYAPHERFHFHVREYTMPEVMEAMRNIGLRIYGFQFSDCWDKPEVARELPPDQWQNMVVIGQKVEG